MNPEHFDASIFNNVLQFKLPHIYGKFNTFTAQLPHGYHMVTAQ